jgi:2-polyprenyl-3-methyl-5-hydroxy-6-metoxy-1,4-benzoquinol methylase
MLPPHCQPLLGTTSNLHAEDRFDTVLYVVLCVDVLEHTQDDRSELARAASHIDHNGTLIVFGPRGDRARKLIQIAPKK